MVEQSTSKVHWDSNHGGSDRRAMSRRLAASERLSEPWIINRPDCFTLCSAPDERATAGSGSSQNPRLVQQQ
ncbi:unnamed protein product [Lampetra planeri]